MSNQLENAKNEFNKLILLYQGAIVDNSNIDIFKEIINIILTFKNNYKDFCQIIKDHLKKDDTPQKMRLFPIIDFLFKSDLRECYINELSGYLYDSFHDCYNEGDFGDRVLLFKIFYTWKYLIPKEIYEFIKKEEKLDSFQEIFEKKFPGKIAKYDEYNQKFKKDVKERKEVIPSKNFQEDYNINNNNNQNTQIKQPKNNNYNQNPIPTQNKPVKIKKLLSKKLKSSHKKSENENSSNKKIKISPDNNNNNNPTNLPLNPALLFNQMTLPINISKNEFKIYKFLQINDSKLSEKRPFFSSIAKYYNDTITRNFYSGGPCSFQEINDNDKDYQIIKNRMKEKLFQETNKNNCAICGFRTLFYNDLVQHLDIHFNFNYLEMEGKNLFRKKGNNLTNWINGNNAKYLKNKNLDMNITDKPKDCFTLENLIFYKNMMNNNLIKINNEQEEDNEEFMYPIYEKNEKRCHYCGGDFKKIFSTKYNYWFYNKVVVVLDDKTKYFAHQVCFEELAKKIK